MINKSDKLDKIIPALIAARNEMPMAGKSAKSNHGSYSNLVDYIEAINPHLLKHDLWFSQHITLNTDGEQVLASFLGHASGQFMESYIKIVQEANNNGRLSSLQEQGKAITYLKRYAASAIFFIAGADDDNDGATSTASYNMGTISEKQLGFLVMKMRNLQPGIADAICGNLKIESLKDIPRSKFNAVLKWVEDQNKL